MSNNNNKSYELEIISLFEDATTKLDDNIDRQAQKEEKQVIIQPTRDFERKIPTTYAISIETKKVLEIVFMWYGATTPLKIEILFTKRY